MEWVARQFFSIPSNVQLKLFTKFVDDELVQIDPEAWPHIYETLTSIWVEAVGPGTPAGAQTSHWPSQTSQTSRPSPQTPQTPQTSQVVRPTRSPVASSDTVHVRKPVIYLYSPKPISINVRLSLVNSWLFSAIYPLAPIKPSESHSELPVGGETISWDVFAEPDGSLRLSDGLEVSYLYWEAE
jgi:hypothetical protein